MADLNPDQYRKEFARIEQDLDERDLSLCTRVHIDPVRCPNVIKEASNWQYGEPSKPNLDPPDKPSRAYDHAMDAIIYWCWQRFGIAQRRPAMSYMH